MNRWIQKNGTKVASAITAMLATTDLTTVDLRDYAGDDNEFALWLVFANRRIENVFGVGLMDLEDWGWRDAYDSDQSPAEAVRDMLAECDMSY